MILTSLPNEVLHAVYAELELCDVKNLRLVSRAYAGIGLEYLVQEVTMAVSDWSITRAKAIAFHLVLCKSVRDIDISCYVTMVGEAAHFPGDHAEIWEKLSSFVYDSQHALVESGEFLASVKAVLPRFPKLRSISIDYHPSYKGIVPQNVEHLLESIGRRRDDIYVGTGGAESFEILAPQLLEAVMASICDFALQDKRRKFSLEYYVWPCGISEKDISSWAMGLESLMDLTIMRTAGIPGDPLLWGQQLARFTAMASNLKSLELSLLDRVASEYLGRDVFLPQLNTLVLFNSSLESEPTLHLLKRNSNMLETLQFDLCKLYHNGDPASWVHLFERAKKNSLRALKSVELMSILQTQIKLEDLYETWTTHYPDFVPPERAFRFLLCQEKTDMDGERDAIFWHPYDWNSITWTSIQSSIDILTRDAGIDPLW